MPIYQASQGIFDGEVLHSPDHFLQVDAQGNVVHLGKEIPAGSLENVVRLNGILSPGLINGHCHVELSHLKGKIAEGTGLVGFIKQIFAKRNDDANVVEPAARKALSEMWENGIQAVGDVCNTTEVLAAKQQSPLQWINFIELSGFVPAAAPQRFAAGQQLWQAHEQIFPGCNQLVPHAPYSVSPALFQWIGQHQVAPLPASMHSQEAAAENEFFASGTGDFLDLYASLGIDISFFEPTGKPSLASVWPHLPNQQMILVHNTFFDAKGLTDLHDKEVSLCLCPRANVYIENRLPDLEKLVATNLRLLLGTDSLASNHGLCIWAEAQTLLNAFPWLTLPQVLRWATSGGADALGLGQQLGRLQAGKQPGIVLLSQNGKAQRLH